MCAPLQSASVPGAIDDMTCFWLVTLGCIAKVAKVGPVRDERPGPLLVQFDGEKRARTNRAGLISDSWSVRLTPDGEEFSREHSPARASIRGAPPRVQRPAKSGSFGHYIAKLTVIVTMTGTGTSFSSAGVYRQWRTASTAA